MGNQQKFYQTKWFLWLMIIFAPYIGLFLLLLKKPFTKKVNTALMVYCCIMTFAVMSSAMSDKKADTAVNNKPNTGITQVSSTNTEEQKKKIEEEQKKKIEEEQKKKIEEEQKKKLEEQKLTEQLTFKGSMTLTPEKGKATVNINTNVPDDGIFEVGVMSADLKVVSDFVPVKDGKVVKEFKIPTDWNVGYISAIAMFRFNLKDHQQPDKIKAIYGQNGEKMLGSQAVAHTSGGKNGNIDTVSVAYPDETTVKETQAKLFKNALTEIIKKSNGVVVSINPRFNDGEWNAVLVTVGDSWYRSAEYEKERFAEQMQQVVEKLVKNAGLVKKDGAVTVFFHDTYGKELASPKMFGGYKILR